MERGTLDCKALGIKAITPKDATLITPEIAAALLELNTKNRPMREVTMREYARRMSNGAWKLNGDTIRLNGHVLLDGQNRLQACVTSGVSFLTFVVNDLPSDVFGTIDDGKKRSHADLLTINKEHHAAMLAAALKLVDRYMTGRALYNVTYSATEIQELLEEHPDIRLSAPVCAGTNRFIPNSLLCACHYLFAKVNQEQADRFIKDLIHGTNLEEGDGVFVLRETLMKNTLSKSKLTRNYIFALTIKAWNFRRKGKTIKSLRMIETGRSEEAFPVIR